MYASTEVRQRMPPIPQRQIQWPARSRRLVDGVYHLERRAAVVDASLRLTVALDRLHQVLRDPHVALAEPAILHRLVFADALTGDELPGRSAAAWEPTGIRQQIASRQAPCG